ncbi:amino acid ABC transporter permease [Bifidobacterium vespertilionis]|uniref:amino acid ABC transporter permease n=1 Tax=Bifidobacterium vespertilionis TaxID=2562524 RepID=UPI001BDCD317|nr:amino acid ABC transporter permease [Bifidobacterium vespertilionis]MBT1178742.1 amino acid ABC transporter permease [Bifidobacterium vespertilionis]
MANKATSAKGASTSASVLFDEPGPKGRRKIFIANIIAGLLLIGLLVAVLHRLANPPQGQNQLSWELWGPALDGEAWIDFYLPGLAKTLEASVIAIIGAVVFGVVFGIGRLLEFWPVKYVAAVVVEFCRAVPVLLFMIFLWRGFSFMGMSDDASFWAVVWGLILYNGSVVAELVRSGVGNLPKGQHEAAVALGMGPVRALMSVEVPQALIAMLPAMITQLVVVLKDTALGSIIMYTDLLQESRRLGSMYFNMLQALVVAAVIYFIFSYLLSKLSESLPARMQRRTMGIAKPPVQAPIAIMDPSNVPLQERAQERERPQGGTEPLYPDHYHGSNAVTEDWRTSHLEHGHDPKHPDMKPKLFQRPE